MNDKDQLTEEKWQAIINNDAAYDGKFIYAVKSTHIFCKPSCKSRAPKKEHVRIFYNAGEAQAANYRPCKRCKPTGERQPDYEWVAQITQYIDSHYSSALSLEKLALECHGSPYHLQRTFKRIQGVTPVEYVQQRRIGKAKELLRETEEAVTDIALHVGIPNTSYFITLFKKKTGQTPAHYRQNRARPFESQEEA
ncbi:bifunctional transcriptional activator/DNA repair enzyme AdaA [Paenibacillus thalictri]|uniref:Methylphosphotriester-DNA--protein-cysteine methyltransferase family protein n=1 Tax=Paenibacillus thalictri TaxID=2527873 RepID=A0A4Q9DYV5_9BACL|nr:bifunctional transcriptional activator/DNA repair enzyme AdaA [Paenibacillus thalictri]TBL81093.1 methylphosphotriester-DNA--protein-cysteine methyltransferase family protein [Paenibacillus thalictri]